MQILEKTLSDSVDALSTRVCCLHGTGGVGKTETVLHYAKINRSKYDAVLWVSADTAISMGQSFRHIALQLGLVDETHAQEADDSASRVTKWLANSGRSRMQ